MNMMKKITLFSIIAAIILIPILKGQNYLGYQDADVIRVKACIKHTCEQEVILINGMITENTPDKLSAAIRSQPESKKTICFNSPGGVAKYAYETGNIIAENKLNTCVAESYLSQNGDLISEVVCGSSCPVALLSGEERFAHGIVYEIFVHASGSLRTIFGFDFTDEHSAEKQEEVKREILKTIRGYSSLNPMRVSYNDAHEALIERAFNTPHSQKDKIELNEALFTYWIFTKQFIPNFQ